MSCLLSGMSVENLKAIIKPTKSCFTFYYHYALAILNKLRDKIFLPARVDSGHGSSKYTQGLSARPFPPSPRTTVTIEWALTKYQQICLHHFYLLELLQNKHHPHFHSKEVEATLLPMTKLVLKYIYLVTKLIFFPLYHVLFFFYL